ncbi:MAG: hypothetical protein ACE5HF_03785 [Gemmatimonadota bacterium]
MRVPTTAIRAGAYATWLAAATYGFALGLEIAGRLFGSWGIVLASALFPLTLAASPWYALGVWGTWVPVSVVYGGAAAAALALAAVRPTARMPDIRPAR